MPGTEELEAVGPPHTAAGWRHPADRSEAPATEVLRDESPAATAGAASRTEGLRNGPAARDAHDDGAVRPAATPGVRAIGDAGLVLGRYRLGPRLGSGGFGTVYEARDERLERDVALKVMPADGAAPERARREALAVARLDHPGIVALFDAGEDEGSRYLVSELVHGRTLAQLEHDGDLSDRDILRAGLALADALDHAHERGVVHRDVKPQNVLVPDSPRSRRGAAKLTDFGVAHLAGDDPLTQTGDVVGTLAYMAPEQAAGEKVDERTDLYALGLVLYEALAGSHPVRARTPAATAKRLGTKLKPLAKARPDLPPALATALDRTLRPAPDDRGTLDELFDALADALPDVSDAGGTIAPHPLERRLPALPPWLGRWLAPGAAALLVLLALTRLTPDPGVPASLVALLAGLAVLVLPRTGWLLAAIATVVLLGLGTQPRPGHAALVLAALLLPPLLLRTDGASWSLPAAAPLLGLAGLAGAYPALTGHAPRAWSRAALGALGAWWLLLAEPLLDRVLLFGAPGAVPDPARWDHAAGLAAADVIAPVASSGAVLLGLVWATAAVVLPWAVRGASLSVAAVMAFVWAGALTGATAALGQWLGERVAQPEPRGLAAGALVAAGVALLRRPRRSGHTEGMDAEGSAGPTDG